MTEIFDNVHGFNLQLPYNGNRDYPDNNGEWIEITKKPNQLPTVKLKTIVLYYRNNGEDTDYNSDLNQTITSDESINYRFYNNRTDCSGQMGWIWGFPLFDVSGGSGKWPKFESCIGNDISGNEKMLVSLKNQKNIIVLDCSGLQPIIGRGCNDISNNIPGISNSFFMTLRIKSSTETDFTNYTNGNPGKGFKGNWNLWAGNSKQPKKWASLVQYEYECDIIGPKSMLDFTFDYFMIKDTDNKTRPIYQKKSASSTVTKFLAIPSQGINNLNNIIDMNCFIITGQNGEKTRMDITNILQNLSSVDLGNTRKRLQIPENWNNINSSTVVKLIGGWYSVNASNDLSNCYYGDDIGDRDFQTNMSSTTANHKTGGWKNFIKLKTIGDNDWSGNSFTSSYELTNILWCSLQSPRKIPIRKYDSTLQEQRFITNWIDLSENTNNKIMGGGYGRYPNTVDMPRSSINPYYSSIGNINTNTVSIENFDLNSDVNYLDSSDNVWTKNDLNYFEVKYQLLIPPDSGDHFKISFTMGKDISSVTTFFRHAEMNGSPEPEGTSNKDAKRSEETITLKWDTDSVNAETYDISMQSIFFTDVASGFKKITPVFDISSTYLSNANNEGDYDISFNVFQLLFFSMIESETNSNAVSTIKTSRNGAPYSTKLFNTSRTENQVVDISYIPFNYEPYRYINYKTNNSIDYENNFYFDMIDYSGAPILIADERLIYNTSKIFTKDEISIQDALRALIIKQENSKKFPSTGSISIDISSDKIHDMSYNFVKSSEISVEDQKIISKEEIFVLTKPEDSTYTIVNDKNNLSKQTSTNNIFSASFYSPESLKLNDYFIPDYWRLPETINRLRTINTINTDVTYSFFDTWINQVRISMVTEILSLALKYENEEGQIQNEITHILVNSNVNSRNTLDYSALDSNNECINKKGGKMIFAVQGALGLDSLSTLDKKPIIIDVLETTNNVTGPFGLTSTAIGGGDYNPDGTINKGIDLPHPDATKNYIVDIILPNIMRQGNGPNQTNLSGLTSSYNGLFKIKMTAAPAPSNKEFTEVTMVPNPVKILLVDLSNVTQTNATNFDMINDGNSSITIRWSSFYFSKDVSWNFNESNVFWTITRLDLSTKKRVVVLNDEKLGLNGFGEYLFVDPNVKIFDKFEYTVTGVFKWINLSYKTSNDILSLNIPGFTTPHCIACKYNRFPYGRFNTTSTNLKLYRPLLINNSSGQEDRFGKKTCGGGCVDPNNPVLNLFSGGSRISSSNNIYSNTTNQLSKKQTYVLLANSRNRPKR